MTTNKIKLLKIRILNEANYFNERCQSVFVSITICLQYKLYETRYFSESLQMFFNAMFCWIRTSRVLMTKSRSLQFGHCCKWNTPNSCIGEDFFFTISSFLLLIEILVTLENANIIILYILNWLRFTGDNNIKGYFYADFKDCNIHFNDTFSKWKWAEKYKIRQLFKTKYNICSNRKLIQIGNYGLKYWCTKQW